VLLPFTGCHGSSNKRCSTTAYGDTLNSLRCTSKSLRDEVDNYCYKFRYFIVNADKGLYSAFDRSEDQPLVGLSRADFWDRVVQWHTEGVDLDHAKQITKIILVSKHPKSVWRSSVVKKCLWNLQFLLPQLTHVMLASGKHDTY
jgi:hypothetical protein